MVVNGNRPTGIIAVNNQSKQYAVVFRGSKDLPDYATDFLLTLVPMQFGKNDSTANFTLMLQNKDLPKMAGRLARRQLEKPKNVHQGFLDAWNRGREKYLTILNDAISKNPSFEIVFTGHSLGGSHAAMAAFDFMNHYGKKYNNRVKVYTFAQPRTGNGGWAQTYVENVNFTRRFTKYGDPGPQTPSKADKFYHHTTEIFIDQSNNIHRCEAAEFGESSGKACINRKFFPILWNHQMKYYSLDNADKC